MRDGVLVVDGWRNGVEWDLGRVKGGFGGVDVWYEEGTSQRHRRRSNNAHGIAL